MKIKLSILAALMAAIFMLSFTVLAEGEEPEQPATEETTEESKLEEEPEETEPRKLLYTIKVVNLADEGKVLDKLSATYELKSIMGAEAAIKYHLEKVVADSGYVVAENFLGAPYIEVAESEAVIYVYPATKPVQVIHHLYDCAGKLQHSFLEAVEMPYLEKLTEDSAPKILKSQIQAVSGRGYALKEIKVKDYEPVPYTIYDAEGHEVTPEPEVATIYLYYVDERCKDEAKAESEAKDKAEAQVDSVTAGEVDQHTLPATGDRSVMAFLVSGFLLGLGIYFLRRR